MHTIIYFMLLLINIFFIFEDVIHLYNEIWSLQFLFLPPIPPTYLSLNSNFLIFNISLIHMCMDVGPSTGTWECHFPIENAKEGEWKQLENKRCERQTQHKKENVSSSSGSSSVKGGAWSLPTPSDLIFYRSSKCK